MNNELKVVKIKGNDFCEEMFNNQFFEDELLEVDQIDEYKLDLDKIKIEFYNNLGVMLDNKIEMSLFLKAKLEKKIDVLNNKIKVKK